MLSREGKARALTHPALYCKLMHILRRQSISKGNSLVPIVDALTMAMANKRHLALLSILFIETTRGKK